MSMPAGGGNQAGAGQQQGQGQQDPNGGAGQQAGQQPMGGDGSLIAAAADGQGQQQGQGAGGQQQGGGQGQGITLEGLAEQLAALPTQFQSELDRRIDQAVSTLDRRYGGQGQQQQGQQQQQDGGQQQGQQQGGGGQRDGQGRFVQQPTGPDPADVREARSVFREAIGDAVRFVDPAERQVATLIGQGLIGQRLAAGADPDTAGTAAAGEVAEQIKTLRGKYEAATLNTLRAQGRLVEAPGTQQRIDGMPLPAGPTGQPNMVGAYQAGQQIAAQVLPNRVRQAANGQRAQQQ